MMTTEDRLQNIERRNPEWAPWLAVVREVLEEIEDPGWDAAVPPGAIVEGRRIPLLAKASLRLDGRLSGRIFENLMRTAGRSRTAQMASLQAVPDAKLDVFPVFRAALNHDDDGLSECASVAGADPETFSAVAALTAMPFLHACSRHWTSSIPGNWMKGHCPVCGDWPAYAEVRGIERARYFRCGRCGAAWQARWLFCPYCGMTDHQALATLVPQQSGPKSAIDACNRCLGYVKAFTTLQASPPATVILDDLASVELDIAAAERGYKRPQGTGYTLDVKVAGDTAFDLLA
jgi:FdhE protein